MYIKSFKDFLAQETSYRVVETDGAFFIDRDIIADKDTLLKMVVDFVASASEANIRAQIVDVSMTKGECVVILNIQGTNYEVRLGGDEMIVSGYMHRGSREFRGDSDALIDIILGISPLAEALDIEDDDLNGLIKKEGNYITCDLLYYNNHTGGSLAAANIEFLKREYDWTEDDGRIYTTYDLDKYVEPLLIQGDAGISERAYLLDIPLHRLMLKKIEDYPIFDEELVDEIESAWLLKAWNEVYKEQCINHMACDSDSMTYLEWLCGGKGTSINTPFIDLYNLFQRALDTTEIAVSYEGNYAYFNISEVIDPLLELVYQELKESDPKEIEKNLRFLDEDQIYKGVDISNGCLVISVGHESE